MASAVRSTLNRSWKHHKRVSYGYWNDLENQRAIFEGIAERLRVKDLRDWQSISTYKIRDLGGRAVVNKKYGGSFVHALQNIYPRFDWDPTEFRKVPLGYWEPVANQKKLLNSVGAKLDIKHLDDWQSIKTAHIFAFTGIRYILQTMYNNSLPRMLRRVFNHHKWTNSTFDKGERHVVSFAARALRHGLRLEYINKALIRYNLQYGNLEHLHLWRKIPIRCGLTRQKWLFYCIKQLYPDCTVQEEFLFDVRSDTGIILSLDIFVVERNIGFEYQGEQHYLEGVFAEGYPLIKRQASDVVKAEQCRNMGITLVHVPYWWPSDISSLMSYIEGSIDGVPTPRSSQVPLESDSNQRFFNKSATLMTPNQKLVQTSV